MAGILKRGEVRWYTFGMPRDCAINCDHIQTVAKGKIGSVITTLPATKMEEVGEAIAFALDL